MHFVISPLLLVVAAATPSAMHVNQQRIEQRILKLAEFGKNPDGGVSRVAFSEADIAGRKYVSKLMREADLLLSRGPSKVSRHT